MPSTIRCFDTLNKTVVTASDLTTARKQTTMFNTLQTNATNAALGPNPLKKTGYRYNSNFYTAKCNQPAGPTDSSNIIVAAKSYELLLDITKGKRFSNPLLTTAAAKYKMWGGNVMEVNYEEGMKRKPGYTGCEGKGPVYALKWVTTATPTPYLELPDRGFNKINFPSPCLDDCSGATLIGGWNLGAYPGYVIDPSSCIFYAPCYWVGQGNVPAWLANTADVSFRWTDYYWRAANAQPLAGMSFPEKIALWPQTSAVLENSQNSGAPLANPTQPLGTAGMNDKWCNGGSKIN
jgi:hypothetical protein